MMFPRTKAGPELWKVVVDCYHKTEYELNSYLSS